LKEATTDIDILISLGAFSVLEGFEGAVIKDPPKRAIEQVAINKSVLLNYDWTMLPVSAAV
jgi:hypothetical protein